MLEKDIENPYVRYAKSLGLTAYKFTAPGRRSVPDRLTPLPDGITLYIEFKRPGEKPTSAQRLQHRKLRRLGHAVYWFNERGRAEALLRRKLGLPETVSLLA